jgi:hypothetical protein
MAGTSFKVSESTQRLAFTNPPLHPQSRRVATNGHIIVLQHDMSKDKTMLNSEPPSISREMID